MSCDKTKRGKSLYINKWNQSAKNYINTCSLCGAQGYNPSIEDKGFVNPSNNTKDFEHSAMYNELKKVYKPLSLDNLGRCEVCARIMDKK